MKFNPARLQGEEVEKMSTMLSNQGVLIEQGPDTKQIADCFALPPYARAVKKIGNEMDLALVDLKEVLSLADIGCVSWKGIGKPLPEEILIIEYFEPNLCAIFGSEVASKLIVGTAGGLSALANIPAGDFSLPKEGKIGEIAEAKLYGMEPCCDGKLVFDAGRVAALLVLGISAPLSNEKHTFSIPPRIFHYAVELLGRISHALSDVMDSDTLLAYWYHCSSSRVMSSGEFDFKRKESFLPVEDGSTNNAIYEKSCSADMQAIKWGKQGR
ncbi:hypothetical protein C3L33_20527, partial [Rhododendron williamsianum]